MARSKAGHETVAVGLVVANLVPLIGVVALGWNLGTLMVVYWLEGVVVGIESVAKVLYAEGRSDPAELPDVAIDGTHVTEWIGEPNRDIAYQHAWAYGFSWVIFGFMVGLFAEAASPEDVALGLIGIVAYRGVSYWIDFVRGGSIAEPAPSSTPSHLTAVRSSSSSRSGSGGGFR